MTYDVRHLFMCLFAICTSSLVRYVLRSLNQFLAGLFAYWLFPQRAFSLWVLWFQVFCFLSSYLMCRFIFFQYLQNLHKYGETLFSSVQFSLSVVSDCLWPHGLQHARPCCPSTNSGACSNSSPSSWWCHPTFSSSVVPFSSCLQSFPLSGSFPVSQFFASGGQSIGALASASVLPMNIQD